MEDASSYPITESWSLLIQGGPGTGKTTLALQFPKPYVADLDNNLGGTIRWMRKRGMVPNFKFDIPDVMQDPKNPEGPRIARPIKERYKAMCDGLTKAAADPDIETIIVDGVSKLNAYIIGEIGRQNPMVEKGSRARKEGEMTLADWNSHLYIWQNFITNMQATPKTFILTAHEEVSDIESMPGAILINVQGKKIQQTLAGMFTDVWRTELKNELKRDTREYKWMVRSMGTTSLQLKNSLALPDVFEMNWETIKKHLELPCLPTK